MLRISGRKRKVTEKAAGNKKKARSLPAESVQLNEEAKALLKTKIKASTRTVYEKAWTQFQGDIDSHTPGTVITKEVLTETLLLNYFTRLRDKVVPSSLWSTFSALKCLAKTISLILEASHCG